MSHTPGPWKVDSSMISTGWVLVTNSNGDVVANVNTETGPDIPPLVSIKMAALSNAHLIAAAPDMLKMLLELQECAEYWSEYDVPLGIVGRLNETIKKARGEV